MSGNGPIQIGDVIDVWGGEVKSSDELMAEAQKETTDVVTGETVISTADAKKKLASGGVMSGHIDEFCRVLSIRLPSQITPLGFLMAFELLLSDMERATGREIAGVGEPIPSYLAGLPIGGVVGMLRKKIVEHAFPESFAKEVMAEWGEVLSDARKAAGG